LLNPELSGAAYAGKAGHSERMKRRPSFRYPDYPPEIFFELSIFEQLF
jgi:hypothetical protein